MEIEEGFEEGYEDGDIHRVVSQLAKSISASPPTEYDDLLVYINKMKEVHMFLAKVFYSGVRSDIPMLIYVNKWGEPVTTRYERSFSVDSPGVMKTLLAFMIAERYILARRGLLKHMTVAIVGLAGSGKTTYSVSSIVGALRLVGIRDWIKYLPNLVFFDPTEFVEFVKGSLNERRWVPAVVVDDVGAQISKYWIWLGQRWWAHLFSVLDHLKDWCGVLIMTASSYKVIPSGLRDKIDLVVEATEATYKGNVINIFTWFRRDKYRDAGSRKPIYMDVMPPTMMVPKDLWSNMMEKRRELGIVRLDEIERRLEEVAEKNEEKEGE